MTDWPDDGDRLLVPVEVEVPEGWDPAPPPPADWKRTWYSPDDLIAVLEPESFPTPEAAPEVDSEDSPK